MSNVVQLRKSSLRKAFEEAESIKLKTWVLVTLSEEDKLKVWGPEHFNFIEMLGMIEYAKMEMEMTDEPPAKRIG
jgi:hypothetical protein